MSELSKDLISLLQYLVPGFLVAWVYFGLTSHCKPSQFERVVQALIFTVVIQGLVAFERWMLERVGRLYSLGPWTQDSTLISSLLTALGLGIVLSVCVNRDWLHGFARRLRITTRSGHPCEWFAIFTDYQRYVVLRLKDGTRVYGWPRAWPSDSDKGHFFITSAVRIVDDVEQELSWLDGLLIDVGDVSSVEFVKKPEIVHEQPEVTKSSTPAFPGAGADSQEREPTAYLPASTNTTAAS